MAAIPPPPPGFRLVDDDEDIPPPPPGFTIVDGERPAPKRRMSNAPPPPPGFVEVGAVPHDGDTVKLGDRNARLFGADAFELDQTGMDRSGQPVPLGQQSRAALEAMVANGATATPTGSASYGRPVVSLTADGQDVGAEMIGNGMAVAAPAYLAADPVRLGQYMEAERLARLNRRGAHAEQFQMPDDYRHKEPWAVAEQSPDGKGVATFFDEATPFQGLRSEIARGYIELAQDRQSKPDDLVAYAKAHGFTIARKDAVKFVVQRNKGAKVSDQVAYEDLPPVLTDPGDGAAGAAGRGLADPFNMLDEVGAIIDSLGGTNGRESVWNSDRRFGDVLWNNIDQNRSILGYDDANHPYARFGGQLASGLVVPSLSVEGVGLRAATEVLRAGGTRFAAKVAAKAAVRDRLAIAGAIEGGLAGGGAGEGGVAERLPGALAGAGIGAGLGVLTGEAVPYVAAGVRRMRGAGGREATDAVARRTAGEVADEGALREVRTQSGGDGPPQQSAPQPLRPTRPAATLAEAREHALDFVGQPIRNEATGVEASVSGVTLKKMTSGKAVNKSTAEDDHALAVANVDDLFRRAELVERYPDERGEPTIEAISRWHAPLETPNGIRTARMTVKETTHPNSPNPLYTVETIELEGGGTRFGAEAPKPGQNRNLAPTGSNPDINPAADIGNAPDLGRTRRMDEQIDSGRLADMAERADPRDVTPLPANTIESLDEAVRANPSTHRDVIAPNEGDELPRFTLPDGRVRRQPLDLVGWLRTRGGLQDYRGELRSLGIDNAPRADLDFTKGEGSLGRLVRPDGMTFDQAGELATEAGFFAERPTIRDFLEALDDTNRGTRRLFHPDDLDTVANFNAARDSRRSIEAAQVEGMPYAEEIGAPVTMADLDANSPPATAYEDLPTIAAKVGNIDVSKLESRGDIVRAILSVHKAVGGFDAARRGKINHGETEALARDLRMTSADLLKRQPGQALNAEQALAARSILAKSADELVTLAEKAQGGSDAALANFRVAWMRHVAIQEQVAGATAEAGRTLSQFRAMAKSKLPIGRIHQLQIEGAGGREELEKAAQSILDARRDPSKVNQNARLLAKPTWKDKAVELYYNSLLSGPQTHAVNILSNTLTALSQLPEHGVAAAIGQARRGSADRVLGSEIGARAVGLLQGVKEGLWQASRTMRTGQSPDFLTKVEAAETEAISGLKGKVIRTPTRALSAEDELFKAMARRMEISGLAVRAARAEGLKGDALTRRTAELVANPTDEMVEQAFDYGRYLTFQRPLGAFGQWVANGTNKFPALKLIAPFVRTPTNILKYAVERSPAAPFLKEWRADMVAGGARRDLALARVAVGSGLGALATQWAAQGTISGNGPADEKARALLVADGWQPYSVRIGDKWHSYRRLDPLATTIGLAADMVELRTHMTDKQREDVGSLLVASITQNLASKTWLSGIADFGQMIGDPTRYAGQWLSGITASIAVPGLVAQAARSTDPLVREARGPIERILSRIPGASRSLEPRRDVFGRPEQNEGGVGPDMVSPVLTSEARNDPTIKALLDAGIGISKPSRSVGGKEMTGREYGAFVERIGAVAKPELDALVAAPEWPAMSRDDRDDAVDKIMRLARRDAKESLGITKPAANDDIPPPPPRFVIDRSGEDIPPPPQGFVLAN